MENTGAARNDTENKNDSFRIVDQNSETKKEDMRAITNMENDRSRLV